MLVSVFPRCLFASLPCCLFVFPTIFAPIMADIIQQLQETTAYIQKLYPHTPQAGIVLGSGLGNFASEIKIEKEVPYADIPHFPVATVEGHSGKLIFGELGGKKIVAMA